MTARKEKNRQWAKRFLGRIKSRYKFPWEVFYETLGSYLSDANVWFDLGCGNNASVFLFGKGKNAVGLDLRIHPNILDNRLVLGNVYKLPFASESADAISAQWLLEHIEEIDVIFGEIIRVLKPGGHFIATTPNVYSPTTVFGRILPAPIKKFILLKFWDLQEREIHPGFYRFNAARLINKGYKNLKCIELTRHQDINANWRLVFLLMLIYEWLTNIPFLKVLKSKSYDLVLYRDHGRNKAPEGANV